MSQFAFLQTEFPEVLESARRAEALANSDPRAACFYARRALELAIGWAYEHDGALNLPYREDLSALIHEYTFRQNAGNAVFQKCRAIKELGNQAVHSQKPITARDSISAVRELFHVCYWFARTYGKGAKPESGLSFDPTLLPEESGVPKQTQSQLLSLNENLESEREKAIKALAERDKLDEELRNIRAEIEAIKRANEATPDNHNYSEAQTRDLFIDLLLREAGWALDKTDDREYEVEGMPNAQNKGFVDYVLWGDDGKPLGLVEAKRTRRDPREGQHQAKLYADCLEAKFGQRPVIFYTNGYDHWIWDDHMYPPREVAGFYTKSELELVIQRRSIRRSLMTTRIDSEIVERYYQNRAIRRISESFEKDHARKALLVMATGSGKTRTVIALADVMIRANWAKRILFLADRTALVNQSVGAFKRFLPDSAPVNMVTEKNGEGRVFVSTYQTMIGLIDESKGDQRRFGPGHFDLVVIDEAHRSIFMKYKSIFEYFDSYLVGLTATPKDEVDRNTYKLFDLEEGVPTDTYTLDQAVLDGFLVPAKSVSVPLRLPTDGIVYDQLSEEEKEQFDLTDWKDRADDVLTSGRVEPAAINNWLFNEETVDKVLKHLMERGQKVDGGDKLGKTILFAKNHAHAIFIVERFNKNYPKYRGDFARVIDFQTEYVQDLIDKFSDPNKLPQLAISVDMLDTGIDIPEVLNLVFFKQVRSKTKFWQMVGRGTRLCPDLFGPGQDKEHFFIFDYCNNLEYFSQQIENTEGSTGASLSKRLFIARLKLLASVGSTKDGADRVREHVSKYGEEPQSDEHVLESILDLLKSEVESMNTDNFIVRAKRRLVEKYQDASAWSELSEEKLTELENEIAGLPTEKESEPVEAKQFDFLILRMQLALTQGSPSFKRLKKQLVEIAVVLEESRSIPMINAQLPLIQDLQSDEWWEDVTLPMLEIVRLRLRNLMRLIEQRRGEPVYTDFTDEVGEEIEVALPGFTDTMSFERFKQKARVFLKGHESMPVVQKLRMNEPLSAEDIIQLETLLREPAENDPDLLIKAKQEGLGLFVRSLVGLDRSRAQELLSEAINEQNLSPNQIEFVTLVIDHLAEFGFLEPRLLYTSPYTDINSGGPEAVFGEDSVNGLFAFLRNVKERALVASA